MCDCTPIAGKEIVPIKCDYISPMTQDSTSKNGSVVSSSPWQTLLRPCILGGEV